MNTIGKAAVIALAIFVPTYLASYTIIDTVAGRYDTQGERTMYDGTWHQYCTELLVKTQFEALISNEACRNTSIEVGGPVFFTQDPDGR